MTDDDVLAEVQKLIKSVWALELLLLLRRHADRGWLSDDLVRELRSSDMAVAEALTSLQAAGFVALDAEKMSRYQPASTSLDRIAARLESLYAAKPLAVAKAIMMAPNNKLRIFSNAFRLKDS